MTSVSIEYCYRNDWYHRMQKIDIAAFGITFTYNSNVFCKVSELCQY